MDADTVAWAQRRGTSVSNVSAGSGERRGTCTQNNASEARSPHHASYCAGEHRERSPSGQTVQADANRLAFHHAATVILGLPMDTQAIQRLRDNITSVYMGNTAAVDRVIACLLGRGHVLIEDVPGVG